MVHTSNTSIWKDEAGGLHRVQIQSCLQRETVSNIEIHTHTRVVWFALTQEENSDGEFMLFSKYSSWN